MKYELSKRIKTSKSHAEVLNFLVEKFIKISDHVSFNEEYIIAHGIDTLFDQVNRVDTTTVSVNKTQDGFIVVADVSYEPSKWFWMFIILGCLAATVSLLIPTVYSLLIMVIFLFIPLNFFLSQKNSVRIGILNVLNRTRDEFYQDDKKSCRTIKDLKVLVDLREKGLLTQNEYEMKKHQFLDL